MSIKFSDEVWENLWGEADLRGEVECIETDGEWCDRGKLDHLGRFHCRAIPLQAGLDLSIHEYEVAEDVLYRGDANTEDPGAVLTFCLSGQVQTSHRGIMRSSDREEPVGHWFLENLSGIQEIERWASGERFLRVYLHLYDLPQLFKDFNAGLLNQLPAELKQTLEGNYQPYYCTQPITPAMDTLLQHILHCPYTGLLKRLYLQGKALELITLQFEQLQQRQPIEPLRKVEIARIHHAREILLQHLDNPPSLIELAHKAGLSDFALKQGFRRVFGTSVFHYLHEHRLEVAQQLLRTSDLTIQQVAQSVGFMNRSYFASAFRKKFGMNPKQYQLQYNRSA